MARLAPDTLGPGAAELVYIAGRLEEAEAVERLLTEEGVDYELGEEVYVRSNPILGGASRGLGFYVAPERAAHSRRILADRGFRGGVVEPDVP